MPHLKLIIICRLKYKDFFQVNFSVVSQKLTFFYYFEKPRRQLKIPRESCWIHEVLREKVKYDGLT